MHIPCLYVYIRSIEITTSINLQAPMESSRMADVKPRISDEADKIKSWKLAEVVDSAHLKALRLPDSMTTTSKVYCKSH